MNTVLTKTEIELVAHRASVLADGSWLEIVMDSDGCEHLIPTAEDDAIKIDALCAKGEIDLASLTPGQLAVVQDCCDGSTFFADSEDAVALGEITRGWLMSRQKAAYSLAEKVGAAIGHRVNFASM